MNNHVLLLVTIAMGATGCAAPVQQARERVGDVVRRAADEIEQLNDEKVRLWRDVDRLADRLACNIPIGAAARMLTDEEREKIEDIDCGAP